MYKWAYICAYMFMCVWAFVYTSARACQGGVKLFGAFPLFTAECIAPTKPS